ncbi:DUF6252 family protein [Bernardetia sp.]|uniref:DUF6252 family protein n=1 Tax=Bernardetia sp. TaxID=1937974 RepID=UPI0025BA13E8|nr:DUF6252 family protein [Bernardetia sp.]
MKKELLFLLLLITFTACDMASVDLDNRNYVFDGRGGVKCKVNGKLLKPSPVISPGANSIWFGLSYPQFDSTDYMHLSFSNRGKSPDFIYQSVGMVVTGISRTSSMVGNIYNLGNEPNQGEYTNNIPTITDYKTNNIHQGTLKILYHDIENNIMGGKFEFDAVNEEGKVVEIREGEFDLTY